MYDAAQHAEDIAAEFNLHPTGKGWRGVCPACNDKNPSFSLSLSADGTRALVYCFAGCEFKDIAAALRDAGVPYPAGAPAWRGLTEAELSEARTILALAEGDRAAGRELSPEDAATEAAARAKVIAGEIERLARLLPIEYDQAREAAAKALGIRASTLDERVEATRRQWAPPSGETSGNSNVIYDEPEPWPEPINGPHLLLDGIAQTIRRHIITSAEAADAAALWIAHTHCFKLFRYTPRFNIRAPQPGCGKSAFLNILRHMVAKPQKADSITPAVVFRLIDLHAPTLLVDEYDTFLPQNEELRGILNAGHERGATALRLQGDDFELRKFNAHAPAAFAGIGGLPGTLHDRSIVVTLQRALPDETAADVDEGAEAAMLHHKRMLMRWTADNAGRIAAARPVLPAAAVNRLRDNWRALFAIAWIAAGDWPQRAAQAFKALSAAEADAENLGAMLLEDIRGIMDGSGLDRIPSADLADSLAALRERPWPTYGPGKKEITPNQVGKLLRPFGVKPQIIRIGTERARGYKREWLQPLFERYLKTREAGEDDEAA